MARKTRKKKNFRRRKPKVVYRYRTKPKKRSIRRNPVNYRKAAGGMAGLFRDALPVILGLAGARTTIQLILPNLSGYMRAGAQVAVGFIGGQVAKMMMKGSIAKKEKFANGFMVGGIAAGIITLVDHLTAKKYRPYYGLAGMSDYTLGAGDDVTYYLPQGSPYAGAARDSVMGSYSMGAYSSVYLPGYATGYAA